MLFINQKEILTSFLNIFLVQKSKNEPPSAEHSCVSKLLILIKWKVLGTEKFWRRNRIDDILQKWGIRLWVSHFSYACAESLWL